MLRFLQVRLVQRSWPEMVRCSCRFEHGVWHRWGCISSSPLQWMVHGLGGGPRSVWRSTLQYVTSTEIVCTWF